ncbi:NERD domain-containing protein [Marinospirillum insulare]|uniref:NERD domain-containing protein n=1 Tax=Marinospirillum insulare TaxID=217169 RepID=A0ABQ5ZXY0_9GAMM|nr:NERD domain-containing protein [Marinospirillum insulare]GLR63867.1 hypothetical protein GCM10007878_13040 [Marinospirillum insulare]
MSILLYGQKADRTHENKMLRAFIQALKADWGGAGKDITLIANSMWDGHEVDLVCLLPTAILVADFKHYSGHLIGTENGEWTVAGAAVKGGSNHRANPFQQVREYKFAIIDWLKQKNLLENQNIGHINGAIVFTGPITGEVDLSVRSSYWFHTTDIESSPAVLADLASTELRVYPRDIKAIKKALGVQALDFDFGQDNYQAKAEPIAPVSVIRSDTVEQPVGLTAKEQSGVYKAETEATQREPAKPAPAARKPDVQPASPLPPQKSRMSGMFKSAMVVGGVFLTMALVSQIYPTIGQSSPVDTSTSPHMQPVETVAQQHANTPAVKAQSYQKVATPVASKNTATTTNIEQIEARSASRYVGQEVTACGTVVQTTPFSKGVYLNLDKPHPQQSLTLVVWDDSLGAVENKLGRLSGLEGVEVCARGAVGDYRNRLQIQINAASAVYLKANSPHLAAASQQSSEVNVERIEAYRAPFYVGKQVMACGVLADTTMFSKGMYLSLDKKYPNQTLTLVVWDENIAPLESKFGSFNSKVGRTFCALGTIEKYKKNLQVQIENPQFLRLMNN